MHPICCGITFALVGLSLFIHSRDITISALLLGLLAAGAASIAFAADVAFVIVARQKVHELTDGEFTVTFGPAVWIVSSCTFDHSK